jgi:hypothetical protein
MRRLAVLAIAPALLLAACATGKSEVPECVRRYTGYDDGCHSGGLGATSTVALVNKTVAGSTKGAVTNSVQGMTAYDNAAANILYAPFAIVGGVFTGFVDGMGHVPETQNCHMHFGPSLGYAWSRDYRVGTADAQVPEHRSQAADANGNLHDLWNGGAYWPGGPVR